MGPLDEPVRHQPAAADELRQHPPESETCRAVRELLRDYVDGDLASAERTLVDEHAHTCRTCSLALARAELEVLRLRAALAPVEPALPSPDFTAGVLRQLAADLVENEPPPEFTPKVMERVRREPGALRPHRAVLVRLLLPTALGLLGFLLAYMVVTGPKDGGLQVVSAELARLAAGRALHAGDELPTPVQVETGAGGRLLLELSGRRGLAGGGQAMVELEGSSRLGCASGGLRLHTGGMHLRCGGDVSIGLGDAEAVCHAGEHWISLHEVVRADQVLTGRRVQSLRIESLRGGAELRRDTQRTRIPAGMVARCDSLSRVELEPACTQELMVPARPQPMLAAQAGSHENRARGEHWLGQVVARDTGRPLVHAQVRVTLPGGVQSFRSDEQGEFRLPRLRELDGAHVLVHVVPPPDQQALVPFGPLPLRPASPAARAPAADGTSPLPPIALGSGRPLAGRLRGADDRLLPGARVQLCLYDEVLQALEQVPGAAATSDGEGRFAFAALPVDLPPRVSPLLLIEHRDHALLVAWDLTRPAHAPRPDGGIAIEWRLGAGRELTLSGLVPAQEIDVVETVPGLAARALLLPRRVRADRFGTARLLHVGNGELWVRAEAGSPWRLAVADDAAHPAALRLVEPVALTEAMRTFLDAELLRQLAGGVPASLWFPTPLRRYLGLAAVGGGSERFVSVQGLEDGFAKPGTQLFLVAKDQSEWQYLGEYDGATSLSLRLPARNEWRLLGIGADGTIGVAPIARDGDTFVALELSAGGGLSLGPEVRPGADSGVERMLLNFRMLDGELDGVSFSRFVEAAGEWTLHGLPLGTYEVALEDGRVARCRIEAGVRQQLRTLWFPVRDSGSNERSPAGGTGPTRQGR